MSLSLSLYGKELPNISYCALWRKSCGTAWIVMRVSKCWQNFHFWVSYSECRSEIFISKESQYGLLYFAISRDAPVAWNLRNKTLRCIKHTSAFKAVFKSVLQSKSLQCVCVCMCVCVFCLFFCFCFYLGYGGLSFSLPSLHLNACVLARGQ